MLAAQQRLWAAAAGGAARTSPATATSRPTHLRPCLAPRPAARHGAAGRGARARPVARVVSPAKEPDSFTPSSLDEEQQQPTLRAADAAAAAAEEAEEEEEGDCPVFLDRNGNMVEVLCCDYGFRAASGRLYQEDFNTIPLSAWQLAWKNFRLEYAALRASFKFDEWAAISGANPARGPLGKLGYGAGSAVVRLFARIDEWLEAQHFFTALRPAPPPARVIDPKTGGLKGECKEVRGKLAQLKLSNRAVWDREHAREAAGGGVDTPVFIKAIYYALCLFLDAAFDNRPIQRFWFLETVARMPYFSYVTMLHLYESLGWWRAGAELRKVHYAEEWNELHHLQIMESLGGDQLWVDRFMAQHAAIIYYWILVGLFVVSPKAAYNFSELIEAHAVDTYGEFVDANEDLLKSLPPPVVAATYYLGPDRYLFDEFQTSQARSSEPRQPRCGNLYDVFANIVQDEAEHVQTMAACQNATIQADLEARREATRRL